jgi:hypothetical protein
MRAANLLQNSFTYVMVRIKEMLPLYARHHAAKVQGSHSGITEHPYLPQCDAVSIGEWFMTFQKYHHAF